MAEAERGRKAEEMSIFYDSLSNNFLNNNLSGYISQDTSFKFEKLEQFLVSENNKYNLTAIKSQELILPLHFADSLLGAEYIPQNAKLLDVGSGAGFPALPFAIARSDISITAIDSTQKKVDFINKAAKELELKNIKAYSARAEEWGKTAEHREKYDLVCARAVSRLNILSELCLPFVKLGGYFLAMKGAIGAEEYAEAKDGIAILGGKLEKLQEKELFISKEVSQKRSFILIQKAKPTPPEYPRMYSKIVKKPL